MKTRYGRGFTLEEIKQAGLNLKYARSIGIAVDARRLNNNLETRELNTKRLKAYLSKLILYPSKTSRKLETKQKKPEAMTDKKDAKKEEVKERKLILKEAQKEKLESAAAKEQLEEKIVMPLEKPKFRERPQTITKEMVGTKVFQKLRIEKVKERYEGVRKKRAEIAQREALQKEQKETSA